MKSFALYGIPETGDWELITGPTSDYAAVNAQLREIQAAGDPNFRSVRLVDLGRGTVKRRPVGDPVETAPASKRGRQPKDS